MSAKDDPGEEKHMKNVIPYDLKTWQLIFKIR